MYGVELMPTKGILLWSDPVRYHYLVSSNKNLVSALAIHKNMKSLAHCAHFYS